MDHSLTDHLPLAAAPSSLAALDWALCLGYLAVVFGMGLYFTRRQRTGDDYFLGGRTMHWLPIGLSVFAGMFSSLSFVGLPRDAAYEDYHLYLAILFIPFVVTPIVWFLFLPVYFGLGLSSAYEYFERRFHRGLRLTASLLFFAYTIGWMGNLLQAVGKILQAVLLLSRHETALLLVGLGLMATLYTALGGVKAVVWTDALQAVALGGGMLLVLLLTVEKIGGGWAELLEVGSRHEKFAMFDTRLSLTEPNLYAAAAFGVFVYLAGYAADFKSVQRYVSMPDIAAARRSLIVNGVMTGAVCLVFFLVGTAVFVFYARSSPGQLHEPDAAVASAASLAENRGEAVNWYAALKGNKEDQLLPRFIVSELPVPGLMGLLLAGLFAAAMSSVDSGINSMAASVVWDWQRGEELSLRTSRFLCAGFGVASVAVSVILYYSGGNVFPLIMKIAGTFLGLLLGLFLLGLFVPRATTGSAVTGLLAGCTGLAAALLLDVSAYWFGALTAVPTLLFGAIDGLTLPPPPAERLRGLVVGPGFPASGKDARTARLLE